MDYWYLILVIPALLIAAVACLPLTAGASSAPMALWVKQDGITPDGEVIPVFRNGNWAEKFM